MEDVVNAIEKLSEKDPVDYLLIIIPIILSFLAIIISISTARKQNRIALFEKKYKALCLLNAIINFEKSIEKLDNAVIIVQCFDMAFNSDVAQHTSDMALIKASSILDQVDRDISVIYYTTNGKYRPMINDILKSLAIVSADAIVEKVNEEEKKRLHKACIKFYSLGYSKLDKKMKI